MSRRKIPQKSLNTLKGKNWLDDEVMNAYIKILDRDHNNYFRAVCTDTFFYEHISLGDGFAYTQTLPITKRILNEEYTYLIIPIHLGAHWILAAANYHTKKLEIYDSFNVQHPIVADKIINFLNYIGKLPELTIKYIKCPKQTNGYDCGVFVLEFIRSILMRENINNIKQKDMPEIRKEIYYQLI